MEELLAEYKDYCRWVDLHFCQTLAPIEKDKLSGFIFWYKDERNT